MSRCVVAGTLLALVIWLAWTALPELAGVMAVIGLFALGGLIAVWRDRDSKKYGG